MKQLIITLLLVVCTVCTAQTQYMKFKGIPIEGNTDSFVKKLIEKGYSYEGKEYGVVILMGEFITIPNCIVGVQSYSDRDQVSSVTVIFPEKNSWNMISMSYYNLKNLLSEKYGTPTNCLEQFSDSEPSTDFLKFQALLDGRCNYLSVFSCKNGEVQLTIGKNSNNTASIFLVYDKTNSIETRKKMMDDL